jgi:polyhydroxyalkanoate synthesis regulator phasin
MKGKHKVVVGAAAMLAAAGGGAAVAASQTDSSGDSKAVIDDAAERLGISSAKLSDALKKALGDRIDAAVAAGRLTQDEAKALKERISSDDFPLLRGLHDRDHGHFGRFGSFDAAADYLGLTEAELRETLESGKSLAQVARDRGKSVDGLVDALVDAAKERLDTAVAAGRITRTEADQMLEGLRSRIADRVQATGRGRPQVRPESGFRDFDRSSA